MLLGVLEKGHGLQDYLLVDAAGIQQMQLAILSPLCKSNMTDIQATFVGHKSQNIAVLNTFQCIF